MIPILFDKSATSFNNNGLGALPDCISCKVTEEKNGMYEAEIVYPMSGIHFTDIQSDRIILCKPDVLKRPQPFRIYNISRPINGQVTINCEHIAYQLNHVPVIPFSVARAGSAIAYLKTNAVYDIPFTITSDITTVLDDDQFKIETPISMRSALLSGDGSFISKFGGEIDYDWYNISINANRGQNRGVTIEYGKNLIDLQQEENISNTITGICPYATTPAQGNDKDDVTHTLPEKYLNYNTQMAFMRILPVDLSDTFDDDTPYSDSALRQAAQKYAESAKIGVPDVSITVNFTNLGDTEEYADLRGLNSVVLCDTVTVKFTSLNVDTEAQVIKTVYDTLKDTYDTIELGETKQTVSSQTAAQQIAQETTVTNSELQNRLYQQAQMITGNSGGYVLLYPAKNPSELLVMDTDDKNTATNVWRFNKNGLMHGTSYNDQHPNLAITMDGQINGQMIAANSINASAIQTDTLQINQLISNDGLSKLDVGSGSMEFTNRNTFMFSLTASAQGGTHIYISDGKSFGIHSGDIVFFYLNESGSYIATPFTFNDGVSIIGSLSIDGSAVTKQTMTDSSGNEIRYLAWN